MGQRICNQLLELIREYKELGIENQINYTKFYLYSIITHSTAIEGSTVTEVENQLLFDEGISAKGRSIGEQLMNLDLKAAYEKVIKLAKEHTDLSVEMLCSLSALVMKNTGSVYNTMTGSFDSSKGDIRLVNVTAGAEGRSYMNFLKVPAKLEEFCHQTNERKKRLLQDDNLIEKYLLSFDAHYQLVTIHPWVDGNGRMSRLVMNGLQFEFGLIPTKISKDNKADYIEALIASREQKSLEPFREFMMTELINNLQQEIDNYKHDIDSDINLDTKHADLDTTPDIKKNELTGKQKDVIDFCSIPKSSREILERIGVSNHSKNREKYINGLVEAGYLEMTNPENPNASNQKYRKKLK